MLSNSPFAKEDLVTVGEALHIAEDITGDYYKFSLGQWKRHRYDVKTASALRPKDLRPNAFALLSKCSRRGNRFDLPTRKRDFYLICLQDRQILRAVKRDRNVSLLSLMVYVFTHELVHIVRFCNFYQRFDVKGIGKEEEERIVHGTTFDILKDSSLPSMNYILDSYSGHRICEMALS
ncbi:MAG: hypothetical protein JRH06_10375 [Deltaproteobacteria bacterium]|nr:hypothetical protein [Deltaproteobacteria bacterium]MBW2137949.1 hypothetical protein [Deltaproteobacteria bacterium]